MTYTHSASRLFTRTAISVVAALGISTSTAAVANAATPLSVPQAKAQAQQTWAEKGPAYQNTINHDGQCGALADVKRPDVLRNLTLKIWTTQFEGGTVPQNISDEYYGTNEPAGGLAAKFWPSVAKYAGYKVDKHATAGSLMVFQPGSKWADPEKGPKNPGHIAWVKRVNKNGSVVVEEEHAPVLGKVATHTVPASIAHTRFISYIH
ncbi:MAG: CHAP domain-containing protein [Solirubrobacterales bacterium]|nr:CHAP domain-containing protein [Solirubrobacterales bacterium]